MENYDTEQGSSYGSSTNYPILSPLATTRLAHYGSRTAENALMANMDIRCSQLICSRAIAAHMNVTAAAAQASKLFPEAADRFNSLAVQNYCHLSQIVEDCLRR